jgi:hypothetical protein
VGVNSSGENVTQEDIDRKLKEIREEENREDEEKSIPRRISEYFRPPKEENKITESEIEANKELKGEIKPSTPIKNIPKTKISPIIRVPNIPDEDQFLAMDRLDETQIVDMEIKGELIEKFMYKTSQGVMALSYAGVKELARHYKNIRAKVIRVEQDELAFTAYADALNMTDNVSIGVAKRQLKIMQKRDGTEKVDEFAFEKACSKAIRNAIKAVIPTSYIEAFFQHYMNTQ